MAIDNQFGKGIGLAAGFDLGAQKPLDARVAVNTLAERDAHVTENRAYEGMLVYVAEENMTFQLVKGEEEGQLVWKEFGFNKADFDGNFAEAIEGVDNRLEAVEEQLANGGAIENRIAQNESDIDGLQGLVGVPKGDEQEATGLHLALNNAIAEMGNNLNDLSISVNGAVTSEASTREQADKTLDQAIKAEASRADVEEKRIVGLLNAEIERAKAAEQANTKAIEDEVARADAEEKRIVGLVEAEEDRAKGVEQGLQNAINAINNEENGILAQAKALDKADRDAQELVDQEQDRRLKALEDANAEGGAVKEAIDQVAQDLADFEEAQGEKNNALDQKDGELNQAIIDEAARADAAEKKIAQDLVNEIANRGEAEEALQEAIDNEKERAEGQEAAIRGEMETEAARVNKKIADDIAAESALRVAEEQRIEKALEDAIDQEVIDRNAAIEDEKERAEAAEKVLREDLAQEIQDRKDAVSGEATARANADTALDNRLKAVEASIGDGGNLEVRVQANEDAIDVINGTGEGSIKKAVADLVNGAPEALNTLDELAAALRDNADVLNAIETAFDGKLATLQADVDQNEADCDAAIAGEKQRAEGQEAAIRQELADAIDQEVEDRNAAILVEKQRAEGQEAAIRQELANEKKALQDEIDADVKVVADELANQKNAELEGSLANQIADEVARAEEVEGNLQDAIDQEIEDRQEAVSGLNERLLEVEGSLENDGAIGARVAALEKEVGNPVDGETAASGLYLIIDNKIAEVNGNIQDAVSGFNTAIAGEKSRAEGKEAELQTNINNEATTRKNADDNLQGKIDAEIDRAKAAEKANADNITALQNTLNAHLTTEAYDGDKEYTDLAVLGGTPEN